MGANMARRRRGDKPAVVAYNRTAEKTKEIAGEGADPAFSIAELVTKLKKPRAVWIMVPAGDATEAQIDELLEHHRVRLDEVRAGETYLVEVASRRFTFASQVINVTADLSNLDFRAQ